MHPKLKTMGHYFNSSVPTNAYIMKIEIEEKELEQLKLKAKKWDNLGDEISKCYCNSDGDYDEYNPIIEGADLLTIGEMAATAFGWL